MSSKPTGALRHGGAGAGRAALLLAVLSISWGSILVRLCDSPSWTIAFWRVALASCLMAPWGLSAAAVRRALWPAAGAGLLLALHFATWIASLSYTSIAASTVLVSSQPIFTVLFSWWFLRETPARPTRLGIALALGGVALLARGELGLGGDRLKGDGLALLGAVFASAYFIVGRTVRERVAFPAYFFLVTASAAACCGLLVLLLGQPIRPASRAELGWLLLMGLVPHVLGHGALNWAVRRLRAYVVNLTVLGEPVLASFYALLIFGEAPPPAIYPGALLIGAGVALAVYHESRAPAPAPPL